MTGARRTAIYGPEVWRCHGDATWSHWDLWLCLVAHADHGDDLDALAAAIEHAHRGLDNETTDAKLSHLDDLARRLADAGLDVATVAAAAGATPRLLTKARAKVLKQGLYARDLTDAMRTPPRARLYERALRGRWTRFAVSPQSFHDQLEQQLGCEYLPKGATLRLSRRVEAARVREDRRTADDPSARLASRRALITWLYGSMQRCDDSYGVLGELGREALLTYAKLPREQAGIAAEDWCEDLCELLVWEDWGMLYGHEAAPLTGMTGALAEHAEQFLLVLGDELRANRLRHKADEALQHVAYLHVAAGRVTRFAPVAAMLGSDHWMPILALAEAALARGRDDVARAVFAAADRPGTQREYLRKRCVELTGTRPDSPRPQRFAGD